jgi:hypothetical protein
MPSHHATVEPSSKHGKKHHGEKMMTKRNGKEHEKKHGHIQPSPESPMGWGSEVLGTEYSNVIAKFYSRNHTTVDISYIFLCENTEREGTIFFDALKIEQSKTDSNSKGQARVEKTSCLSF